MSLLRLPTLDRPSLGLSKRFTFLTNNTTTTNTDDANNSLMSSRTLPPVERLDTDEFLNMFGAESSNARASFSRWHQLDLSELGDSPRATRFPELHGRCVSPDIPARPATYSAAYVHTPTEMDQSPIDYRLSISSSNPSTKLSHTSTSTRGTRNSSASSMTEDYSASEYSSRDSERESALHERLKKRSKQRRGEVARASSRFSGRTTQPRFQSKAEPRLAAAADVQQYRKWNREPQELDDASVSTIKPLRPLSRGGRLGQAMAEGLAVSPQSSPRRTSLHSHTRSSSGPLPSKRLSTSRQSSAESTPKKRISRIFPTPKVDFVDRIRVGIMCQLTNLADLKACSQVSHDFRQTFQKYETLLVDRVLYQQSVAAWELRNSVRHLEKPSPFRLRSVLRDFSTIDALEDFIVWRCRSMLRYDTLSALTGESPRRKAKVEDALWLIWTFCNIFGKTSMSDATLTKQAQWLQGDLVRTSSTSSKTFSRHAPASTQELEDMCELWACMETLLSGFKGQEEEARRIGLFDSVGETTATDTELLNAWICDVLSLGPKAVLTLSSCDFEQAKVLGVTRWTPPAKGKSRANFLKAAVEDVYRERLMQEAKRKAAHFRKSMKATHQRSRSDSAADGVWMPLRTRPSEQAGTSLRVDTKSQIRQSVPASIRALQSSDQRELRPDCDPLSPSSASAYPTPILSPASNPMAFSPLALTKNASAKLGANLFPMQNRDQSKRQSVPLATISKGDDATSSSDVVDPIDRAVVLLVYEMGFSEANAKRALAMSDTGAGIDVQRAIEILSTDGQMPVFAKSIQICELPAATGNAQFAPKPAKVEYCEGTCKPLMLAEGKKDRLSGLSVVKRGMSSRMSFRKSNRLSVIVDDEDAGVNSTLPMNIPYSATLPRGGRSVSMQPVFESLGASTMSKSVPSLTTMEYTTSNARRDSASPVSPVGRNGHEWIGPDANPLSDSEACTHVPLKPRITLTRVGTGINKRGWSLAGRKRKERMIQPEIIGYAY